MRLSRLFWGILVLTGMSFGLGSQTQAQDPEPPVRSLEQRFEELNQEVRMLKRKRELEQEAAEKSLGQRFEELDQEVRILKRKRELEQEAADTAKKTMPILKFSGSRFSLESADRNHVIRFRGLLHVDHRLSFEGANDIRNRTDQRAGDLDDGGFHEVGDSWFLRRARPFIEAPRLESMISALFPILAKAEQSFGMPILMLAFTPPSRYGQVYRRALSD